MRNRIVALLAAVMVTAVGCGAPAPVSTPSSTPGSQSSQGEPIPAEPTPEPMQEVDRDTIYTVYLDNNLPVSFDADGNEVEQEPKSSTFTLNDTLTGEPRYQKHTKTVDTGKDNEYGAPITLTTTALYDMDGKLLYDYGKYDYDEAVGTLLVRKEHRGMWASIDDVPANYFSELWDPATDKSLLPNVSTLTVLDKDKQLMAACDIFGTLLGTVDASGSMVKSYDKGYQARIFDDRIVVSNTKWDDYEAVNQQCTMLNNELEPVTTADEIFVYTSLGNRGLFQYRDKGKIGLMDSDGKRLFALSKDVAEEVVFCDGELVIMRMLRYTALMTLDGTQITEAEYDQIVPVCLQEYNLTEPPSHYVARKDSTVSLLDRQGKVVLSNQIEGLNRLDAANGNFIFFTDKDYYAGLLDMKLETVLPAGRYDNIQQHTTLNADGTLTAIDIIEALYYPGTTEQGGKDYTVARYDLYDGDMNLIADSLTSVGTVGKGRIAVVRGFSAGVIDWQGNWIGKTTIFRSLNDDRREMY